MPNKEYSKGYAAGRGKAKSDIDALKLQVAQLSVKSSEREERIFMQCLELALKNCNGWKIGNKRINSSEGYCRLAKVFADNAINELNS